MLLNLLISKKEFIDRDKIISFECGFDCLRSSRLPFSIHFYLVGILFLVFDVEIIFLFPIIDLFERVFLVEWLYSRILILLILLFGLEFEKNEGSLKWFF